MLKKDVQQIFHLVSDYENDVKEIKLERPPPLVRKRMSKIKGV